MFNHRRARPWCLLVFMSMALLTQIGAQSGAREKIPGAQNSVQLQDLAKFAVQQYNSKQGLQLKFVQLVSAEQQVVSGIMYYLVIEASLEGNSGLYEAQIWVQAWRSFKSLRSFRAIKDSGSADVKTNV